MNRYAALKDLTVEELLKKREELKHELFNFRFQNARGELENPKRIRQVKADIARVLTRIKEIENG